MVTSSCVDWVIRLNRTYFLVTDTIWVFHLDILITFWLSEGRWLTGEASARASEETGVQLDPMHARLDELSRRLESQESLIRTLQATQSSSQRRPTRNCLVDEGSSRTTATT